MEEIKIACRKCKEEKSESEMKRDPRGKFGFQKICKNCENDRHKKYRESQKDTEEWKEKEKAFREVYKNDFFACETCQILIKNKIVHEKSEYHQKNSNNGWTDDKEKRNAEHFQPRIMELKMMFPFEKMKKVSPPKLIMETKKKKTKVEINPPLFFAGWSPFLIFSQEIPTRDMMKQARF